MFDPSRLHEGCSLKSAQPLLGERQLLVIEEHAAIVEISMSEDATAHLRDLLRLDAP